MADQAYQKYNQVQANTLKLHGANCHWVVIISDCKGLICKNAHFTSSVWGWKVCTWELHLPVLDEFWGQHRRGVVSSFFAWACDLSLAYKQEKEHGHSHTPEAKNQKVRKGQVGDNILHSLRNFHFWTGRRTLLVLGVEKSWLAERNMRGMHFAKKKMLKNKRFQANPYPHICTEHNTDLIRIVSL